MSRGYVAWTESDRERLVFLANKYTDKQGRVTWSKLCSEYPYKSKQQLKSYYLNVLKMRPKTNVIMRNSSEQQVTYDSVQFFVVANSCDRDTDLISLHFPTLTKQQILDMLNNLSDITADLFGVMSYILSYPNREFQFRDDTLDAMESIARYCLKNYNELERKIKQFRISENAKQTMLNGLTAFEPELCNIVIKQVDRIRQDLQVCNNNQIKM